LSPRPDHLPRKRGADTDENRNRRESKGARYSPASLSAVARELITLETSGATRRAAQPGCSIFIQIGVDIAVSMFIVERWTFDAHRSLGPLSFLDTYRNGPSRFDRTKAAGQQHRDYCGRMCRPLCGEKISGR